MGRRAKEKFLATIPPSYDPNYVDKMDGRTKLASVIPARIHSIETDLGGVDSLSYARRSLVKRAVWLEAIVETYEQNLAADLQIDLGAYTQAINSLLGLFRLLGLERRARRGPDLQTLMRRGTAA